eukprot:Nk52_evm28s2568 gene=Nk52_evmTU28s2568
MPEKVTLLDFFKRKSGDNDTSKDDEIGNVSSSKHGKRPASDVEEIAYISKENKKSKTANNKSEVSKDSKKKSSSKKEKTQNDKGMSLKELKAMYSKVTRKAFPEAKYFDQHIECHTMSDGRELILGNEVWGLKDMTRYGMIESSHFTCVPGRDVLVKGKFNKTGNGTDQLLLTAHSLPDMKLCAEYPIVLSESEQVRKAFSFCNISASHFTSDCNVKNRFAFKFGAALFYMELNESNEFILLSRFNFVNIGLSSESGIALWHKKEGDSYFPYIIGSDGGVVHFISLKEPFSPKHVASVKAHYSARKSDRYERVFALIVHDNKLITCGTDRLVSIIDLNTFRVVDDNVVASKNMGVHFMAINPSLGVVFTGSQPDNKGTFWDLKTWKRIRTVVPIQRTGKFLLMPCTFASDGTLVYTSSNNRDDPTLNCLIPKLKKK